MANVVERRGRPFGAVLVKDDAVVAIAVNDVEATGDPTAHAELQAIRAASRVLGSPRLDDCIVYASGHPCPMCLSAMYLTGIDTVYCALPNEAGEPYGLSTGHIYSQLSLTANERTVKIHCVSIGGSAELYEMWLKHRRRI